MNTGDNILQRLSLFKKITPAGNREEKEVS